MYRFRSCREQEEERSECVRRERKAQLGIERYYSGRSTVKAECHVREELMSYALPVKSTADIFLADSSLKCEIMQVFYPAIRDTTFNPFSFSVAVTFLTRKRKEQNITECSSP